MKNLRKAMSIVAFGFFLLYAVYYREYPQTVICLLIGAVLSFPMEKWQKKLRIKAWLKVVLCIFLLFLAVEFTPDEAYRDSEDKETIKATVATTSVTEIPKDTEAATELAENQTTEVGSSKDNPYILTVEELVEEINSDIDAAKAKYNDKWIQITGTISDTSDGGIVYGYYIHGESTLTGYRGLRIICWCEDGPYSGSVMGDTKTFLGQMREVTTVNATEIGDCEIIK